MEDGETILLIEDDREVAGVLREFLEQKGHHVIAAHTGEEGLQALRHTPIALVLLDLMLPDRPGISLLREIRGCEFSPEVVIVTGHADLDSAIEAVEAGAAGYLLKPVNFAHLSALIARLVEERLLRRDNARLRRLVAETEARHRAAEGLLDIAWALGSTIQRKQVLKIIAQRTAHAVGAERCSVHLLRDGHLVPVMSQFADGHTDLALWEKFKAAGPFSLEEVPAHAQAIRTRRPVPIEDAAGTTWVPASWVEAFGVRSILVVPLTLEDAVIGTLTLGWLGGGHAWRQEQVDLATTIAAQAALAFENARLYEETGERLRQSETLLAVSQAVGSTLDLTEVARRTTREMVRALGADFGGAWLVSPSRDRFLPLVGYHVPKDLVETFARTPLLVEHPLIEATTVLEEPLYASDSEADPKFNHPLFRLLPHKSVLILPIRSKGEVIGGFAIVWVREAHRFTPGELRLAEGITRQAAVAIENARLHEEVERRRRAAEGLADVGRLVTRSLDPEEVGQQVVESLRRLLGALNSALFRLDPESGDLKAVAVSGDARAVFGPNLVFPRGTGLVGRAVLERRPVFTADLFADPQVTLTPDLRARIEQAGYGAVLAVPLLIRETVVGALGIGEPAGRLFDPEEVRLAQAFADQAAIALENARLYRELRAALEEIEASQQRVVQSERLRAVGEMAAGVAHDFNNVLATILGRAQLLLPQTGDPELQRQLHVIERAARDGARTVRRIQEFARMRPVRPFESVDLNRVVEEVVEVTRSRWKDEAEARGITYEVRVEAAPLPPVAGDPAELREALTNLAFNALDAMPEGGRLTFRTGLEGERAWCAVADTGIGMPEDVRQRVFDPFFTTKADKGSGLGLSIVYGIVTRHGGEIEVRSRAGQGTTFTVWLPLGEGTARSPASVSAIRPTRTGSILVIEDEADVREVLVDLLAGQGHAVAAYGDGASGLARLREDRVDLVISDLGMPGLSGWEVARLVRQRHPGTPVALITGWGDGIDPEEARAKGVDFLVGKPFTVEDVTALVARALGNG